MALRVHVPRLLAVTGLVLASVAGLPVPGGPSGSTAPAAHAAAAALVAEPTRPLVVRGSTWYVRGSLTSGPATTTFSYGDSGDLPVAGDWDGNGTLTPGVVRSGVWHLRNSTTSGAADVSFGYGNAGDVPVVGDWDGNGTFTPGVVRGNVWYLRNSAGSGSADVTLTFGDRADLPVAGDWNGDGVFSPGVVRGTTLYLRNQNTSGVADLSFAYGDPGDRMVVGDWDGNRTTTPGIVRNGQWYLRNSNTSGVADVSFAFGDGCDLGLASSSALVRDRGGRVSPGFAGTEISVLPTSSRVVALTFDAGGDAAGVERILGTLQANCVPATFFFTGQWAQEFPQAARTISLRYPVGNHTFSHPDLTTLGDAAVRDQIRTGQAVIQAAATYDPRPLFRFPFGARDARTLGIVGAEGYASIRWTVDTLGWQGTSGGQSASTVVSRVLAGLQPGEIVLMHVGANPDDRSTLDADALPTVIRELRARGYSFVTVGQLV